MIAIRISDNDIPVSLGELLAGHDAAVVLPPCCAVGAAFVIDDFGGVVDLLACYCYGVGIVLFLQSVLFSVCCLV